MTISSGVFLLLLLASFSLFGYNASHLIRLLLLGKRANRFCRWGERIKSLIVYVFGQKRVLREPAGIGHFLIFWGFIVLTIGTVEALGRGLYPSFSFAFLGRPYRLILLSQDIFGVLVSGAILVALYRRFIIKPDRLPKDPHALTDATIILTLILGLMVTMYLANGLEMASGMATPSAWQPVSSGMSQLFVGSPTALTAGYHWAWWIHIFLVLGFLNYLPFSKHLHIMASFPNIFFRSLDPKGRLHPLDLENEATEDFGAAKIQDFSWKDLLDTYSCTECGRCQENCPAYNTGKPLNPKQVILDLKAHLLGQRSLLLRSGAVESGNGDHQPLVADEVLWDCTTCRACVEHCPLFIEHVDKIVDMRRHLVQVESRFPPEVQTVFRNLETNYNPWSFSYTSRADWCKGLNVKTMPEANGEELDYLFFVGCAGSYDDRYIRVTQSLVNIFQKAGVRFAILGTEERCTGDPARRIGNEYLAQELIQANVETMKNYRVKRIVTACPHCFNTLKNEYPDFGGHYEVTNHTELIHTLIREGRLRLRQEVKLTMTYHDSCYLGRYNDIYASPRNILQAIPGVNIVELPRNRQKSFCCGAGGGRMWMEEHRGSRINYNRTDEVLQLNPQAVGTACPFCLTMLRDGLKAREADGIQALDVAEVVARAL